MNHGKWTYDAAPLIKHGFNPRQMDVTDFIKDIWDDTSFVKNGDREALIYKGEVIGFKPLCEFHVMEHYSCPDPEVRQYQVLIRRQPKRVMAKGGIEFHGPDESIITFRSDENIRSMKDRKI